MEELFTCEEISQLLYEVTDPIYQIKNLWHPGFTKCQVQKVSDSGLILVTGNNDTGYKHIVNRHNWTRRDTFREGTNVLEAPTTFEYKFAPIHIIAIADQVFTIENRLPQDPDRPHFEVFEGISNIIPTPNNRYRLVLYRHTKIIHTLYPLKSSTKKKKHELHLIQGGVSTVENVFRNEMLIKIPFFNKNEQLVIRLTITQNNIDRTCTGEYIIFDQEKKEMARYPTPPIPWIELKHIDAPSYYKYIFNWKESGIYKHMNESLKTHGLL